jgi:6-phosphogluconate dehydrogenase (decarboxylating)
MARMTALDVNQPCINPIRTPVMAPVQQAFRSREEHTFAEKVLSAMRYKFGGHVERAAGG